jgi:hypothetical protein
MEHDCPRAGSMGVHEDPQELGHCIYCGKKSEDDYPQDDMPSSVYEWSGHNELCDRWVEGEESWRMDATRSCTCGGTELPGHLKTIADILNARAGTKAAV